MTTQRTTNGRRRGALGATSLGLVLAMGCGGDDPPPSSADGGTETSTEPTTGSGADESGSTGEAMGPVPTWHQDIAPIVVGRCAGCHDDGGVGPFSLADYDAAFPWAPILTEAVHAGTMPPFAADDTSECEMNYGWQDDLRLSDEDKQLLQEWADGGAPEGDPAAAAPLPVPPDTALTEVDQSLPMTGAVTIGGTQDEFLCFSLDPQLEEDRYLRALQIEPGNDKIVHHVLIYVDEEGESAGLAGPDGSYPCSGGGVQGQLIGAWAPGALPNRTPEGVGMRVPAGSRIVMNVHYHPTGAGDEVDDGTRIDFDWLEEVPAFRGELALIGNGQGLLPGPNDDGGIEFRIPAGVSDHVESMLFTLPADIPEIRLWQVGSHMHYLGVDMIIGVRRSASQGPAEECLLHTPTYSFEWQRVYAYDADLDDLPRLAGGDELYMRCTYDNTLNTPGVVEALGQMGLSEPVEVVLGEETLDEMCLGIYGVIFPNLF